MKKYDINFYNLERLLINGVMPISLKLQHKIRSMIVSRIYRSNYTIAIKIGLDGSHEIN